MRKETKDKKGRRSGGEVTDKRPQSNRNDRIERGTVRRPMGITIPEGEGRRRRSRDEKDDMEEEDPTDPRGKRPAAPKRKKKKSKQTTG